MLQGVSKCCQLRAQALLAVSDKLLQLNNALVQVLRNLALSGVILLAHRLESHQLLNGQLDLCTKSRGCSNILYPLRFPASFLRYTIFLESLLARLEVPLQLCQSSKCLGTYCSLCI